MYEEWVDYIFIEDEKQETIPVKILTSDYYGVKICYGVVKVIEGSENATLSFTYKIVDAGDFDAKSLNDDLAFKNFLGDLLRDILIESSMNGNRKADTEEPDYE